MALLRDIKDTIYALNGKLYQWRVRDRYRVNSYNLLAMCNYAFEYKHGFYWIIKNRSGRKLPSGLILPETKSVVDIINTFYGEIKYTDPEIYYLEWGEEVEKIVMEWKKSVDKI